MKNNNNNKTEKIRVCGYNAGEQLHPRLLERNKQQHKKKKKNKKNDARILIMDHDAYIVFEDDLSQVTTPNDVQTVSPLDDEFLVINYNEFATIEDDLVSHITIPKLKLSLKKKKKKSSTKKKTTIEKTSTSRSHKTTTTTSSSDNNKSKRSSSKHKKTKTKKSKSTHRVEVSIKAIIEEDENENKNESNVSNPDEGIQMEGVNDPFTSSTIFERRSSDEINRTTSTKSSSNNFSPKKSGIRGGRQDQNHGGRSFFKTTTPLSLSVPDLVEESLPHEDNNARIMDNNNTLPSTLSLKTTTPEAHARSLSSFDMVGMVLKHVLDDTTTAEWKNISPTTDIIVPPSRFVYRNGKRIRSLRLF